MRGVAALILVGCGLLPVGVALPAYGSDGPVFQVGLSTSFVYDFNRPRNQGRGSFNAKSYASREQADSFNIDLLQLGITGTRGRASYGAKIDFGDLAEGLNDSGNDEVAVQEAWVRYAMEWAAFTAGRFGTPIGYEAREPWANTNVSRSYGWDIQPSNHDGVTVAGGIGALELMVGIANGFTVNEQPVAGVRANDFDDEKAILGKLAMALGGGVNLSVAGIYNELLDTEKRTMITGIASGTARPGARAGAAGCELRYALEAQWRQDRDSLAGAQAGQPGKDVSSWGLAGYLATSLGRGGVALRFEWVQDGGILTDGFTDSFGKDVDLWEVTTTFSWRLVRGVDLRLEYRHDQADEPIYADGGGSRGAADILQAQVVWHPGAI